MVKYSGLLKCCASTQARWLFLATLIGAVVSRWILQDASSDPYKCKALMHNGQWYGNDTWLTPGCVSDSYGIRSITRCLSDRKVVFLGDETVEEMYRAMALKLNPHAAVSLNKQENLEMSKHGVDLEYHWDPFLNGSYLADYRDLKASPALLVVGGGHWHAENEAVDNYIGTINNIASTTRIATPSLPAYNVSNDLVLLTSVQEPYNTTSRRSDNYRQINEHLIRESQRKTIHLVSSFSRMRMQIEEDLPPIAPWTVANQQVDVLLGLKCNADISARAEYTFRNTRTCCSAWAGPNWIQISLLTIGLALLPGLFLLDYCRQVLDEDHRQVWRAFGAFTFIISLQFITDRTHIFEQVRKLELETVNLYGMLGVVFLAGVVSIRRSHPKGLGEQPINQPFLSRDQSDELKGWMQLSIIIYHCNKAWEADWFWEIIRTVVAAYLFLTGYGHTQYFLQKQDYSFRRVVAVMLRTNLLPWTLAYMMRTRWLLYYYMPLSSFWFLVLYGTLAIGFAHNRNGYFLFGKILISAFLVNIFISTPELPETVVKLFTILCNTSFDGREFFRHRVRIDQYIVYIGMLAAIFHRWANAALSAEDQNQGPVARAFRRSFHRLRVWVPATALPVFFAFWYYVNTQFTSQHDWTAVQPYITFIPIISFLLLRNAHPALRNTYSSAFAWVGRYSGELYVMQCHIWLAGDQEAVLRTGFFRGDDTVFGDRWRDLVVTTPLFFIACQIVGDGTGVIAAWFVEESLAGDGKDLRVLEDDEVTLLEKESQDDDGDGVFDMRPQWLQLRGKLRSGFWPHTVRNRTMLVLAGMWILNLVRLLRCLSIGCSY